MNCPCPSPGFCPVLGREMPERLHFLCQTRADYRNLFREQAGLERDPNPQVIPAAETEDGAIIYGCSACEAGEKKRRAISPRNT